MIIAGGAGTRLWPLSTPENPKQLLPLTGSKTLVQYTYARAKLLTDDIYVVVTKALLPAFKKQLPQVHRDHFIVEPDRRGTGNCIVLALHHLHQRHADDEPVAFLYSDYHITDETAFKNTFTKAATAAQTSDKIVLVGSRPDWPSTALGYIERLRDQYADGVFTVGKFREKPSLAAAKRLLKRGNYLWSSGYYVATPRTFLMEISAHAPKLAKHYWALHHAAGNAAAVTKTYLKFDVLAIDKEVIEVSKNMLVVEAAFEWVDVGNYKDLHRITKSDQSGNAAVGAAVYMSNSKNCYVNAGDDKPVVIVGAKNLAVVTTEHGVLVLDKKHAHKLGDELKKLQNDGS